MGMWWHGGKCLSKGLTTTKFLSWDVGLGMNPYILFLHSAGAQIHLREQGCMHTCICVCSTLRVSGLGLSLGTL